MKKILFLGALFLFLACSKDDVETYACDVDNGMFDGDVALNTQAELEEFGALCYSGISGTLQVWSEEVTDLSPLANIRSVGALSIWGTAVENLRGINLTQDTIENIEVINNERLRNFKYGKFPKKAIRLDIGGNGALKSFKGMEELEEVLYSLSVGGNGNLSSVEGLNGLTSWYMATISNNPQLKSLEGLENLQHIEELYLQENGMENLKGLENLTSIGLGNLMIIGNSELTSLQGLENLNTTGGDIYIGYDYYLDVADANPVLTDYCALENLFSSGNYNEVIIVNNAYNPTAGDIANGNCSL